MWEAQVLLDHLKGLTVYVWECSGCMSFREFLRREYIYIYMYVHIY